MFRRFSLAVLALTAFLCVHRISSVRAAGTISLPTVGVAATENFNTLATTGTSSTVPTGWDFLETGTNFNILYTAGTGSGNAGDTYSFGAAASSERAFGGLLSGSLTPTIGASFTNNTGVTITSLAIAYTGEQWRLGTLARADRLDFQISTDATSLNTGTWTDANSLDFTAPVTGPTIGALDGNAAANRTALSFTITGLNIASGATFWIRWADFNASGADDGLAVDDFSLTPNPAGGANLSINDVTLAEGNAGTTAFSFTVSLSAPAGPGGVTFDIATQNNSATVANNDYVARTLTGQSISAGSSTYAFSVTVNGDTTPEPNETFFVNVTNVTGANVTDGQGLGTIQNDDVTLTPIHDIQGPGASSPLSGTVTTSGTVTGVKSNGFFMQEPDATVDANPLTSEGIFVFTSSTPPVAAVVGNLVQVTGTVFEFVPSQDPQSPPITEITSPTVVQLSTGNPLPVPVPLTSTFPDPAGLYDQLERVEGMRVSVNTLTVVAPTDGNVNEANATSTSNGIFFGVVAGVLRPFRESGVQRPDGLPAGAPANVPRFDTNPELIRVDGDGQTGGSLIDVTAGATVSNLIGPLDYAFRYYTIVPDPATPPIASGNVSATAVPLPGVNQFTVASFNMERLFDTVNDPAIGEPVLTTTAFNNRLNKASLAIRNVMGTPDVIGVQEIENLPTLQALATKVNNDALAASQPNPNYTAYLVEGNDVGGIDVGFLLKSSRVAVVDVTQQGLGTSFFNPDMTTELLNDRPTLVLRASISGLAFTVIVNHLRSLNGISDESAGSGGWPTAGARVRAKRKAQAEELANLIQRRQTSNPSERIVVLGDFNAFQFNDGFVDVVGTVRGTPTPADQVVAASSDLVNPDLTNLLDSITAAQRYSYVFSGSAQVLDQVLVNTPMQGLSGGYAIARANADFPETLRNDSTRPERLSDHDMPVAYFNLPSGPPDVTSQFTIARTGLIFSRVTGTYNQTVTFTNKTAGTISGPFHLKFSGLTAGVALANATGSTGGAPYITIPAVPNLGPGASASVGVRFSNPGNVIINYSLAVLAGTF